MIPARDDLPDRAGSRTRSVPPAALDRLRRQGRAIMRAGSRRALPDCGRAETVSRLDLDGQLRQASGDDAFRDLSYTLNVTDRYAECDGGAL